MDTDTLLKYHWQQTVLDALLELEPERLPQKILIAETAINERLHGQAAECERAALNDALHLLHVIFPA